VLAREPPHRLWGSARKARGVGYPGLCEHFAQSQACCVVSVSERSSIREWNSHHAADLLPRANACHWNPGGRAARAVQPAPRPRCGALHSPPWLARTRIPSDRTPRLHGLPREYRLTASTRARRRESALQKSGRWAENRVKETVRSFESNRATRSRRARRRRPRLLRIRCVDIAHGMRVAHEPQMAWVQQHASVNTRL
jgi:hypothetical protein